MSDLPKEANITINGRTLTPAQVTTVKTALAVFIMDLIPRKPLTRAAVKTNAAYLDHVQTIWEMMRNG